MNDGDSIRLDVFGRRLLVVRANESWQVNVADCAGKCRPLRAVVLPGELAHTKSCNMLRTFAMNGPLRKILTSAGSTAENKRRLGRNVH